MKIGVIGIGIVGGAMVKSFEKNRIDIICYDKFKNIGSFDGMLETDIVFLCLPTLYNDQVGSYDKSAIYEVCEYFSKNKYNGLIIIKSTVEPTTSQMVADKYGLAILHNPEFLTARTACDDFHNQEHIIIGKTTNVTNEQLEQLVNFYKNYYPNAEFSVCSSTESESVKIFCNCFYATKIQFLNELYLLCQKININYDTIKNIMLKNNWINPMHTDVPGPDGKLSYGGMCFPKDTSALLSFMKFLGTPHKILEATVIERITMREDK